MKDEAIAVVCPSLARCDMVDGLVRIRRWVWPQACMLLLRHLLVAALLRGGDRGAGAVRPAAAPRVRTQRRKCGGDGSAGSTESLRSGAGWQQYVTRDH